MATSSIIAKIGLNSAGFKTGLAQCRAMATRFKSSVGGLFSGVGGQVMGMLGISAGIAGISALTKQTIDLGGRVEDMARNLRMGKAEFQTIAYAAKLAGMEESRLVMTMNNLNLRTIEACDGNQSYRDAFDRLGISLKEFASLSPDKKLEMLGKAFKRSGESLASLNDISQILGQKTGPQMLEVLDKISSEGMENLTKASIEAGHVMDEATLAALANAGDEIDKWQNKIIVAFGGFLADMGSSFGRSKWLLIVGQKLAEVGEFIEVAFRDIGNYVLGIFASIGRYINGQFGEFITPIRNVMTDFISYIGNAFAKLVGYFDSGWERAINRALKSLDKFRNEANKISEKNKNKSFSEIFGEEMLNAKIKNNKRQRSDLWSSNVVDWYDKEIERAEKLRKIEKNRNVEDEKARKAKYDKADKNVEVKETKSSGSKKNKAQNYNDSSLAKIGGGGLTAARYDVSAKQLSETKKQSKLLEKIVENTAQQPKKSDILMK